MHYVIESRKVSKDIKKLKERLKKGRSQHLFIQLILILIINIIIFSSVPTEKPVWDSENWPLMVDFEDSKVQPKRRHPWRLEGVLSAFGERCVCVCE